MKYTINRIFFIVFFLFIGLSGCGSKSSSVSQKPPSFSSIPVTEAPQKEVLGTELILLDISYISKGYMTVLVDLASAPVSIVLIDPSGGTCTYFIEPGEAAVLPFTKGNGEYLVSGYQQLSGSQYSAVCSYPLKITLENEFLPFLFPNQYVDFLPESDSTKIASTLSSGKDTDLEILEEIYLYVIEHVQYDTEKAKNVEAGYLPDIDAILQAGRGICFDYAALTAAMLRSQGIPCKLQIGYAGDIKHAWIDVYLCSEGWIEHAFFFEENSWKRLDPTFDSNAEDKEQIYSYIEDSTNYLLQLTY